MDRKPCRVPDCHRRIRKGGLCSAHLKRGMDAEVAPRVPTLVRDGAGRKRCCSCQEWLDLDLFCRDARAKDGRRATCLACHRNRRRFLKFGVTEDWFEQTLEAQGSRCAICRSPDPRGRGWAIDHDHACCPESATSCGDCVRGILCNPCNLALGLFGERPDVLMAAQSYLAERMSIVRGV